MFQTSDHSALKAALDDYPVPMFATERQTDHHPFQLICLNAAHTKSIGLRPLDFWCETERRDVGAVYDDGARGGADVNYCQERHLNGCLTKWETTLLQVTTNTGAKRLIGVALTLGLPAPGTTISDVDYYAAQAKMQLRHIGRALQMLHDFSGSAQEQDTAARMIGGLNCSLDYLMQDLRHALYNRAPKRAEIRVTAPPRQRVAS